VFLGARNVGDFARRSKRGPVLPERERGKWLPVTQTSAGSEVRLPSKPLL
jgi:hypothetical protein